MPVFPFGILFFLSLLLTAVFGAVHWAMAWEEGIGWGLVALLPVVALGFTYRFWRWRRVRWCFWGGVFSFTTALASFVALLLQIPGFAQQFQTDLNGQVQADLNRQVNHQVNGHPVQLPFPGNTYADHRDDLP